MTVLSTLRNVQGIGNAIQGANDLLGRLAGGSFWEQLKPASYRGFPFVVLGGTARVGRRNALHEYPFRDTPWVEDLGRQARKIMLTGFIVGDDVIARRDALIKLCEASGDGELVHPTLGRRTVALMDFSTTEHWDQGRYFELQFSFVEQGARLYPKAAGTGSQALTSAAGAIDTSALRAFTSRVLAPLQAGAAAANAVAKQASAWAAVGIQMTQDATSLLRLAVSLPGEFGRLLGQLKGITAGQLLTGASGGTVLQDLIGNAAAARTTVASQAAALNASGAALGPSSTAPFALAAQSLAAAVRSAAPTPGDAVRGLLSMVGVQALGGESGAAVTAQQAGADAMRRACIAQLAIAAAAYQGASSADMLAVRAAVLAVIDAEITIAGNQREDEVYQSLRVTRAVVVQALNAAGATLPDLVSVATPRPMPALALAQRLYRDPSRSDELVQRANPVHPAFMPVNFKALNT